MDEVDVECVCTVDELLDGFTADTGGGCDWWVGGRSLLDVVCSRWPFDGVEVLEGMARPVRAGSER